MCFNFLNSLIDSFDDSQKKKIERVSFFLLGMVFMMISSTWTMFLADKNKLIENEVNYIDVVSYVPVFKMEKPSQKETKLLYSKTIHKEKTKPTGTKRSISNKGISFIRKNEGFAKQAYWDVNGITVGFGHKINSDDPKWLRDIEIGNWISKSTAATLFSQDIDNMVNPGISYIIKDLERHGVDTKALSQGFIDGLGDLIYNCGLNGVMTTDFYAMLKSGKTSKAIELVPVTRVLCKAHKTRRAKTKDLMLN